MLRKEQLSTAPPHSPLRQLVPAGPRRPGQEAHVPRGAAAVLAAVAALLDAEEGVQVAAAAAVVELHARLLVGVVAVSAEYNDE